MNKKFIIGLVGLVGLVFLLMACGGSGSTDITDNTTVTQPTPVETYVAPVVTPEEQYLYDVHNLGDYTIDAQSDSSLLELGHNVCSALNEGNTVTELVLYLINSGAVDGIEKTAGSLIGASVKDFCPEYSGQLQDFVNSYG